jgi:hypothetical protein
MWRRGNRKDQAAADEVIAEASDLVCGEMSDRYLLDDRLPPWVIINTLAHSEAVRLRAVADDQTAHDGSWQAIASYLAVELLHNSTDTHELARIQRDVLVPLELRLLNRTIPSPRTPAELAALVTSGISDLRSGR